MDLRTHHILLYPTYSIRKKGTDLMQRPIPFASLIGIGTSIAAGAGSYAVARVRITRYLERANKDYFIPRGLLARIAKQNTLPQIVRQSETAPLLAPLPNVVNAAQMPTLRDRRLQALGTHVAHIEYQDLPAQHEQGNMLDQLSAKMQARKAKKQEEKAVEHSSKYREDADKEMQDLRKEEAKLQKEMDKVIRKERGAKQREEVAKIEEKRMEAREKFQKKVGDVDGRGGGGGKEDKAARKFMFVVVMDARAAQAGAGVEMQQQGNAALR